MTFRAFLKSEIRKLETWQNLPLDEIDGLQVAEDCWAILREVEQKALSAGVPEAVKACQIGVRTYNGLELVDVKKTRQILAACLAAIPEPKDKEVYSLKEAAKRLGYSESGLRKIVKREGIKYAQTGQGPIKFRQEWLDEYLSNQQSLDRAPAQKRRQPIIVETNHGFDPSLLQADDHSGSA